MAVFTEISQEMLETILSENYNLGELFRLSGIQSGSQNTNYWFRTEKGEFVFTLFENSEKVGDIEPVSLYSSFLNKNNVRVPSTVPSKNGELVISYQGNTALVTKFVHGFALNEKNISESYCKTVGYHLKKLHLAAKEYDQKLETYYDIKNWINIWNTTKEHPNFDVDDECAKVIEADLAIILSEWPDMDEKINIHGDLFPDNVLFIDDMLTGLIDFNFSFYETPMYDLAIALIAWSFDGMNEFRMERFLSLVKSYSKENDFWLSHNYRHLPFFLKAATFRYLLSRCRDKVFDHAQEGKSPLDPKVMLERYKFMQKNADSLFSAILKEMSAM